MLDELVITAIYCESNVTCVVSNWNSYCDGFIISINYSWNDKENNKDIHLTIHQTFLWIQIIIETDESKSRSICGSFDIEKMRGRQHLIYSYLNEPNATVRDRSQIHYGTAMLEFNDTGDTLNGTYWTDRKSVGDMNLKKV